MVTPELLLEAATRWPEEARRAARDRPLLEAALEGKQRLEEALVAEERREREEDRKYWEPLRRELEQMRHERRKP